MAKKKGHESAEISEAEALGKRVDAIMDPNLPDPAQPKTADVPPIDIFKDAPADVTKATKTAPEVSGKLLQKVDTEAIKEQPQTPIKPRVKPAVRPTSSPANVQPSQPEKPAKPAKAKTTELDDQATEQAVDDIAAKEANTMLALQDAIGRKASHVAGDLAQQDRRRRKHRRMWFSLFLIIVVLLFLLAVPHTRYTCRWPVGIRLRLTTDILPSVCK